MTTRPSHPARTWRLPLMAVMAVTLAWAWSCAAGDVVIIRSSDAEPYSQAESAVREQLTRQGHSVRAMTAKEASDRGLENSIGHPAAVVAVGTPAARWLHKQLPADVKLTYCMVTGADEAGLLSGRATCGVTTDVPLAEQFKLIGEALPRARSLGVLYRSDSPASAAALAAVKAALPAEWRCEAVAVNEHPSIAAAIDALTDHRIDAIWTAPDPKLYDTAAVRALLLAGMRKRVPVWGFSPQFVRAGALIGVGVDPKAQGKQAAEIAAALISADPTVATSKARPPEEYEIAVNLIVARQLDLDVPDSLSRRATFVYRPER